MLISARISPTTSSLREGVAIWSSLGGDHRSFDHVVRTSKQPNLMFSRGRFGGVNREGFRSGRGGRGAGCAEALGGFNPRGRGTGRGNFRGRVEFYNRDHGGLRQEEDQGGNKGSSSREGETQASQKMEKEENKGKAAFSAPSGSNSTKQVQFGTVDYKERKEP